MAGEAVHSTSMWEAGQAPSAQVLGSFVRALRNAVVVGAVFLAVAFVLEYILSRNPCRLKKPSPGRWRR